MAATFQFDPARVAHFEASGWRAYYDRRWLGVLRLIVALCQEQFRIPFPASWFAAYYTTRASMAWVPLDHDEQKVQRYLEKFYRIARRYSGLKFDPEQVGRLELQYFDVHRRLAGVENKSAYIEAMTSLHSAIFGISAEQARESAEWRVQASNLVDGITGKTSTDVEGDWATLEDYLARCYRSIKLQVQDASHVQMEA
jgi:hypothetical protein